jgi:hypothetical protein
MQTATQRTSTPSRLLRKAAELGPRGTAVRAVARLREELVRRYPSLQLRRTALAVHARTGKSVVAQLREIRSLRRGPGRLPAVDYYAYELYDDRRYSFREKAEFVGWKPERLSEALNDPHWRELCDDKLLSYALLAGLELPHPEVYAVYHPTGRTFGRVPSLHTPEAMADFLRAGMRYPFFGKPVKDSFGGGASSVDAIDRERDVLRLRDGEEIGVEDYVRQVPVKFASGHRLKRFRSGYDSGYLFQERIVQHPIVDRLSGGRVSSLRLVVLLGPRGPHVHRVTWKLPVGSNITDHVIGRSGNIKCAVDPHTGRVERVVRGRGPARPGEPYALGHHGSPTDVHPDTQERLTDVQLPCWEETIALCLHAATALPGLRYQSWDMALAPSGPTFLEVNYNGGISQVPGYKGLNDDTMKQFIAEAGLAEEFSR